MPETDLQKKAHHHPSAYHPAQVHDLWFPDDGFWESKDRFSAWIQKRMYGGMDDIICTGFRDLTIAAAKGELDDWGDTAEGRIALLIALDQFPRSLWRDTPAAYAQDIKANRLVLEGIQKGHFAEVAPWKKMFYIIALGHCEGVDHLDRLTLSETLIEEVIAELPPPIAHVAEAFRGQAARIRGIIERFGRHPHRNPHFGRVSSAEEDAYIATGDFPHVQNPGAS